MPGRTPSRRIPVSLAVAAVVIALYSIAGLLAAFVPGLDGAGRTLAVGVMAGCLAGAAAWIAGPRLVTPPPPLLPAPPVAVTQPETQRLLQRLAFDRQLHRALDDAADEDAVHQVAGRALEQMRPAARGEVLLLAGRNDALVQVVEAGPDGEGPGCPVAKGGECAALRLGRTMRFGSRDDLDACPHLVDRDSRPEAAVCVPLRVLGRPAGVLHRLTETGEAPGELEVSYAEGLAAAVSSRLTMLRAAAGEDPAQLGAASGEGAAGRTRARVLPLSTVQRSMSELSRTLRGFAVAQLDIDHLDDYARRNGHADAALALDLLAEATARCVRPDDLVGVGNAGELIAVFPDTGLDDARRVLGRVREEVVVACQEHELEPFSVAGGVVESSHAQQLGELFEQLDAALTVSRHHHRPTAAGTEGRPGGPDTGS
ncbi:MAG: diguanylate cyclase [Acidimicrobiales bacterium]